MKKYFVKVTLVVALVAVATAGLYVSGIGTAGAAFSPGAVSQDPLASSSFQLEVPGTVTGYFNAVYGLGSETEVVEVKTPGKGGKPPVVRLVPSRLNIINIELRRGLTSALDIWNWRQQVVDGKIDQARKNATITMIDQAGTPVAKWELTNAWPSKLGGPMLSGESNQIGIETVTLVCESLKRVK